MADEAYSCPEKSIAVGAGNVGWGKRLGNSFLPFPAFFFAGAETFILPFLDSSFDGGPPSVTIMGAVIPGRTWDVAFL